MLLGDEKMRRQSGARQARLSERRLDVLKGGKDSTSIIPSTGAGGDGLRVIWQGVLCAVGWTGNGAHLLEFQVGAFVGHPLVADA